MIQSGMMGLLDAAQRYQTTEGAQFETYASQRIRGAMLDELRQCDWLPRSVRRSLSQVEARSRGSSSKRPGADRSRIRERLDLSLEDYQRLLQDARGYQIVSYDDFGPTTTILSSSATQSITKPTRFTSSKTAACAKRSSPASTGCPSARSRSWASTTSRSSTFAKSGKCSG